MVRIILVVCSMLIESPYWFYQLHKYENTNKYSVEERYQFVRRFVKRILRAGRIKVVCTGKEKLPKENGYLITPNHQGLVDPLVIALTHAQPTSAVVKKELENVIVVKSVDKAIDAKLMDRSNLRSSMKVLKEVTKEIQNGRNYIIFPEGTRSKKGNELLEFKAGTFKAAIDSNKAIVPVALIDCFKAFDTHSIKRLTVQIHYLDPIYPDQYQSLTSSEIAKLVQKRIEIKINEVLNESSK